jgi:serine/threonine-protein kinase
LNRRSVWWETMGTQRAELNAGSVLGRYELLLPVAKGGMGQVWAGRLHGTRGFQKLVAIKTLLPTDGTDKQLEKMLLSEAALASRIKHPNVVEGLDLGEQDGTLYFVMEWVSGEALDFVLKGSASGGLLPLPIVVQIAAQACSGLQAAHDAQDDKGTPLGLVHRDVSPQNLLVAYAGTVKLADFGVAKATQQMSQGSVVGQVKGKFPYMSPEQVRGAQLDGRSDIFAMGVVLYRMLTGKHPFKGQTPAETLGRILSNQPPPRPSTLVPSLPVTLDAVVMRALAADRDQRFSTAREMSLALESALPGTTPPCSERDLEAMMIKLFGRRLSDRRHALTSAAALVDAKGRLVMPAGMGGASQARSQSTMRAVMVSVDDANEADIVVVGDDAIRLEPPALPPQLLAPEGLPSLDFARIRPSIGTEPSVEELVQISSSVMPPPIEPTGSTWQPLLEARRSSRRRSVLAIGASAVLVLGLATAGLATNGFRLPLGDHDSGAGVSAAVPLAREPAAPAPSTLVAAAPKIDPSSAHRAEPGDVDAADAGLKMAAPLAHPALIPPRSATPGSRDRRGLKGGGDGDRSSRRTDRADPAPADPANPPAWDPLRARK